MALDALLIVKGLNNLMGIEGQISHLWFRLLHHTLPTQWEFNGRNRRPPRDAVNALLSLGYTLLATDVRQMVIAEGLDPALGLVSRRELDWHFLRYILELREAVLAENYRVQPLRRFTLRKADGRQRVLSAQYLCDKVLQRALLIVLEPRAEALFHEDSFAYRPKRGVKKAMIKVNERVRYGLDWLVDADIQQFFDGIPHTRLKKTLQAFIADKATMKLMEQWLKQGCHHQSLLGKRQGISQGAILSPLMCNLYLHEFDCALTRANIPFVRFADDFLLFAPTKAKAEAALHYIETVLAKLSLQLHPDKTQVVRSHTQLSFLGERLPNPTR